MVPVDNNVAIESPSTWFAAARYRSRGAQGRRMGSSIGDAPFVDGRVGADDNFANQRVYSISADHGIGLGASTVGKGERDLAGTLIEPGQFLIEMNCLFRDDRGERAV